MNDQPAITSTLIQCIAYNVLLVPINIVWNFSFLYHSLLFFKKKIVLLLWLLMLLSFWFAIHIVTFHSKYSFVVYSIIYFQSIQLYAIPIYWYLFLCVFNWLWCSRDFLYLFLLFLLLVFVFTIFCFQLIEFQWASNSHQCRCSHNFFIWNFVFSSNKSQKFYIFIRCSIENMRHMWKNKCEIEYIVSIHLWPHTIEGMTPFFFSFIF